MTIKTKTANLTVSVSAVFIVLTLINTCSIKRQNRKLINEVKQVQANLDSLANETISKGEMVEIIKRTPAWKTLRIEEISDKERISINALEEGELKK